MLGSSAKVILSRIINSTKLMFKEQLFLPLWLKEIVTTINCGVFAVLDSCETIMVLVAARSCVTNEEKAFL